VIVSPNFKQQNYGVQLSYPLFQGGKLVATRKQAQSQLDIALAKYQKAVQDMNLMLRKVTGMLRARRPI